MASGPGPAAPQRPQWGTVEGGVRKLSMHRHPNGADDSRPKHGALAHREYGLLSPEDSAGDPAAAELWDCGDCPKDTMVTGGPDKRATKNRDQNGQRALLACGQTEDADVKIGPP